MNAYPLRLPGFESRRGGRGEARIVGVLARVGAP